MMAAEPERARFAHGRVGRFVDSPNCGQPAAGPPRSNRTHHPGELDEMAIVIWTQWRLADGGRWQTDA
jgi:hypothetical protein